MSAPEDPVSLLEWLKQRYGVEEADPLHGPSVTVRKARSIRGYGCSLC